MTIDLTASRILRLEGSGRFVFFCDHASNYIPAQLHDLGLPAFQLARHIAWDIGASGVTARALYGSPRIAGLSSLAVHGALVAVILLLGAVQPVQSLVKQQITALEVDLRPYLAQQDKVPSGGGGGGARQLLDARDELGRPRDVRVLRSLGFRLDQKAVEAVTQWRFKPGLKDGKPVPVMATIEVNFRLL